MKWINNSVSQEYASIWDHENRDDVIEELALTLEALPSYVDYSYFLYTGYFKAPATTNYRFYGTGDDWVRFSFSNVSMDKTENLTTSLMSDSMYAPNERQYYRNDSK